MSDVVALMLLVGFFAALGAGVNASAGLNQNWFYAMAKSGGYMLNVSLALFKEEFYFNINFKLL